MPWDFTKIPSSGTTKWDFSLNKLIEMVDAGDVSLNDLPDKTRASILSYKLRTGAISKDNLSTKDWQLLTRQGMSPATTEDISKAYATQGVKNPPEKYPYWYGQLTSGLLAPVPTDSSKINPPRSTGEKILGDVLGTAGALASMPGMVGRGLASLAPKLAGALQIGGMTAVTELPKVMTQQETPTEAARNVAISAAVGAAGDVVAPLVRRSVANTLAKYFPEQLPKALETAVPYVAPVAVGAGVGAAQGTAKQVTKWIAGEPIDLSQAIKDIGAEAAIMGTVNGIMAAMGLVPKGNTAGYYKFAKSLIQTGADNPDTFMEIPGMPGLQFQYNPKTARIGYRIDPDAIPNFLQQAEAMGSLQTIAPEATQTTGAIQPVTAETIQTQAGESIQPAPLRATTGLAVPTTAVSSTIKPGDTVYDPRGTKLTVVDASDPSLLTVQNEQGTTFKIGRKVVSTEPPSERATKPVETTSAAKTIETTSTPKMEASIASTVATESPFAVGDKVQFTDGSKTITARIIRELGWSDTHPYREYIVEDESTKRQYSVIEPLLSKVEEKAPEAPETATPEAAALAKSETPKTTSQQPEAKEPWQMTEEEFSQNTPPGFVYDRRLPGEARTLPDGRIVLGPKFFYLEPEARKSVLLHELVHTTGIEETAMKDDEFWRLVQKEHMFGPIDEETGRMIQGTNGQVTPLENLTEAYKVLFEDPVWLKEHYPKAYAYVAKLALKMGKPVPPEVLKDYPDLAAKYSKQVAAKPAEVEVAATTTPQETKPAEAPSGKEFVDPMGNIKAYLSPKEINVDPQRFQFKITGERGITGLLRGVTKWDPKKAGVITVWKDKEGRYWVVNGHHRLELAQRLNVPVLEANVLREEDGITASDARAIGALQNIAEGRGTAIDAAKFFRERKMTPEDLKAEGVSLSESKAQEGLALASVTDSIFNAVVQGELPVSTAVVIGQEIPNNPTLQNAVMELLAREAKRGRTITGSVLQELIRGVKSSSQSTHVAQTLFGEEAIIHSNAIEKAELLDYIKKQLRLQKRVFATVSKENLAKMLAKAGNVLQREANLEMMSQADMGLELISRLAHTKGTAISETLNKYAEELAHSQNKIAVKQQALSDILKLIKEGKALEEGIPAGEQPEDTPYIQASASLFGGEEGTAAAGQGGTEAFFGKPVKLPKRDFAYADPVSREEIVKTLSKQLNISVRVGRFRGGALGIFKVKPEVIRSKVAHDLPVIAHEVGHYLDKKLSLSRPEFDSELQALGRNTSRPSYGKAKVRREGVAEYLRLYLTDPEQAQNSAPAFHKFFEETMVHNPEIHDALLQARADIANWMSQPAKARMLSQMSIGERAPRRLSFDRIYAAVWDELAPLQKAVNEMSGGKPIPIDKDPFRMAWLARGWTGKAEAFLLHGVLDDNFNKVGPSLSEILEPVKNELDDFRVYITAKRAQELHDRGLESGFGPEDITEILQDPKNQKYEPVRQELIKFQDAVLGELVKSGRISAEQAAAMRKLNQDYVPFYRVMDDPNATTGFGGRGYANIASPVKRIKGSGRRVIDPLESIVRNTFYLFNIASRNEVGKLLADLAEAAEGGGRWVERIPAPMHPVTFRLEEIKNKLLEAGADITGMDDDMLAQIFSPVTIPPGKENILIVYRDGKPEFYQCDPELYRTMLWLNRASADILTKILRVPASWLRAGAVLSPEFVARNPIRDQLTAFLFSKFGYVPGYDLARGLFHVVNRDDLYWKWKAAGGGQATLVSMDRDYMQKTLADLLKDHKVQYYMSHPLDIIRALSEGAEESTRIGEFIRGLEKLGTSREAILEAALASRDVTLDFNRKGWATGPLNQVIAFFNASLQDLDKLQRAIRENPKRFFLRVLVSITIPSIILYLKNRKDSRYQRLPDWLKDNYWIITTKDNIVRLPKPFMPGLLFGTVPERIMAYIEKQDPSAFDGLDNTIREAFPDLMPTALIPWVEVIANKDLFRGAPIVPAREQKLPAEMQYAPYTSETAKWLGDLLNASPRIIDHIIQGYGGGTAQAVTDALDALLEALGIANPPPKPAEGVANVPVLRGFTYSELRQSGYVDKVYTQFDELSRKVEGAKRGHGTLTAQENKQYIALKNATDALNNIGKQIRTIEESQQFTSEQKAAIIKRLRAIEDAVAMQALGVKE